MNNLWKKSIDMVAKSEKPKNTHVIANQSADWCGNPLNQREMCRFRKKDVRKSTGLPRQCAHCLAMTCSFDTLKSPVQKDGA